MVSHFGEVLFPSSRSFWDNEDEYDLVKNLEHCPKLYVHWLRSKPKHMQKLIIMEGNILISFVKQYLCPKIEEACIIKDKNDKKIAVIYQIDKEIYLCIILSLFNTKDTGVFISEISDFLINADNIISIVCHHVSQFQSTNIPNNPSFLRILTTKNINVSDCEVELLEQPNIIFGVSAGVLSYAELMDLPAKLYVFYIDSFVLDSECAEPILKVLTKEMHYKLHFKFVDNFFSKGNLYI